MAHVGCNAAKQNLKGYIKINACDICIPCIHRETEENYSSIHRD